MYNRSKVLLYGLLALLAAQLVTETVIIGPIVAHQKSRDPQSTIQNQITDAVYSDRASTIVPRLRSDQL